MNDLFVLIPCYNEEANIGDLIDIWMEQATKLAEKGYILKINPIDDCSKDNTKQVILSRVEKYPENVSLIEHEVNKNLCGGLNTSISFFTQNGSDQDLMCIMDGDNTQSPVYIHDMLDKMFSGDYDVVIASRYREGADVVGLKAHRKAMSDLARIYYTLMLHVPGVRDYTCGYRLYKYPAVKRMADKFGTEPIKEKTFACMMEFLYKLHLSGSKFGEVGFKLRYDQKQGESKMKVGKTMLKSLSAAWRFHFWEK